MVCHFIVTFFTVPFNNKIQLSVSNPKLEMAPSSIEFHALRQSPVLQVCLNVYEINYSRINQVKFVEDSL